MRWDVRKSSLSIPACHVMITQLIELVRHRRRTFTAHGIQSEKFSFSERNTASADLLFSPRKVLNFYGKIVQSSFKINSADQVHYTVGTEQTFANYR